MKRLPIATLEPLQMEYARLQKVAPGLADALHRELATGVAPNTAAILPDELRDELWDLEREIERLEERRDEILDELSLWDGPLPAKPEIVEQAETVRVLLKQYEGRESEVLKAVLQGQAVAK